MKGISPINILVRVPNWIGDAVMCLPALMDLRERFAQADITVLARPTIAELLAAHGGIKDVMVYEHQTLHHGPFGLMRLSRVIRKRAFDAAVLFQNAFEAALLAWLSRIPTRIGYATDGRGWLLSHAVPPSQKRNLHQIRYYQQLVQAISDVPIQERNPKLEATTNNSCAFQQQFGEIFSSSHTLFVGINPGSLYGSAKRWPPERFAEVGDRLVEQIRKEYQKISSVRCVLIGGKGEEALGMKIASQMRSQPIVLSGKTTIQELMNVLPHCAVLVTNDTGPMHVAQALGVPVVGIFGSTDPESTGPVGEESCFIREPVRCSPCLLRSCPIDHRCMANISTDQVVRAVMARMDRFLGCHHARKSVG
ncbi:MAG: lipopolysaccharide heptosyltransferase II [Nitrospirales bacterium]